LPTTTLFVVPAFTHIEDDLLRFRFATVETMLKIGIAVLDASTKWLTPPAPTAVTE
jgi:hypothetical protein